MMAVLKLVISLLVATFIEEVAAISSIRDANAGTERPNIIFILTDDQDVQMNSLSYMGGVQEHLVGLYTSMYALARS